MFLSFLTVLAWISLVACVLFIFAVWRQHAYMLTPAGQMEQAVANVYGKELRPRRAGPAIVIGFISMVWLIAYRLLN